MQINPSRVALSASAPAPEKAQTVPQASRPTAAIQTPALPTHESAAADFEKLVFQFARQGAMNSSTLDTSGTQRSLDEFDDPSGPGIGGSGRGKDH